MTREAATDASGRFRLPLLPSGRYSVTAAAAGYSTVTLVEVVVVPGEERTVRLEVRRTDEEELVTETINAELQAQGIEGGWVVPAMESEVLPLLRGTVGEVAGLFPVAAAAPGTSRHGEDLPLEAAGPANAVTAAAGAAVALADANRLTVVPRWGSDRTQLGIRLVRGDGVSNEDAGAGMSSDDWFRGALTIGTRGDEGSASGFLSIDHDDRAGHIAASRRTAIVATASLATSDRQSLFFAADAVAADGPADDPHSSRAERTRWSATASHAWQVSARTANALSVLVDDRAEEVAGAGRGIPPSLELRERSLVVDERLAWLPVSGLRHELRGGVHARVGIDHRLTIDAAASGAETLRGDRDETSVWLEDELMQGSITLRGGVRVDAWEVGGNRTTDVAPRLAIAWHTAGEEPLVLRGSWGRFHELPDLRDVLPGAGVFGSDTDVLDDLMARPMRTDRAVIGVSRDLSGLAAWSFDVVSSRIDDRPWAGNVSSRGQEIERLEVTVGGRLDVFGMADAVLAWTWSDSEGDLPGEEPPEHRGSLAIRAALPADWAAAGIVRHVSGIRDDGAGWAGSSTTLDLALSRSFAPGDGVARLAIEAFNVTGEEPSIHSDRPARSVALNLSYRFGY